MRTRRASVLISSSCASISANSRRGWVGISVLPEAFVGRETAVAVRGLWAGYDRMAALESVSFELPAGALVGLAGPNGSGKSTALKKRPGLVKPWGGRRGASGAR